MNLKYHLKNKPMSLDDLELKAGKKVIPNLTQVQPNLKESTLHFVTKKETKK